MSENKKEYEINNSKQFWSETDPFTINRYKQFFKYFKHNENIILDVGCNTGRGGETLKKIKPSLVLIGIDIVEKRVQRIQNGIYDKLLISSSTNIPLDEKTVDVIIAGEFIEHLYSEDIEKTLNEFLRILKDGGRVMLTTPNPSSLLVKLGRRSIFHDPSHFSIMKSEVLSEKLRHAGFVNVVIKGSGKASTIFGDNFFFFPVYGSYLLIAEKIKNF